MSTPEIHETAGFRWQSDGHYVVITAKDGAELRIHKVELSEGLVATGCLHIARVELREEGAA